MRCISAVFLLGVMPAAFAQSAPTTSAELPHFEVATIKPVDIRNGVSNAGAGVFPGGRVVIHALSLKALIAAAFDAGYWQLSGGDDWMEKDVYDIEAKPSASPPDTFSLRHTRFGIEDERLRQMLQALLIDRFQLKLHRETKDGRVYLLQASGKTFQLQPTKYTSDNPLQATQGYSGEIDYTGHWFVFNSSMPQLAKFAADYVLHRPVLDRTGLTGSFDYRDPDAKIPQEMDFQGSFPIFIQTIGLKLTSANGPVETLVIDHAEKPSPN